MDNNQPLNEVEKRLAKEPKYAQFFLIKNWFNKFQRNHEESKGFFKGLFDDFKSIFHKSASNIVKSVDDVNSNLVDIQTAVRETLKSIDSKNSDKVIEAINNLKKELENKNLSVNVEAPIVKVPEPKIQVLKETEEAKKTNILLNSIGKLLTKQTPVTIENDKPLSVNVANFPPQIISSMGEGFTNSKDYFMEVSRRRIDKQTIFRQFGSSPIVNNQKVDIWTYDRLPAGTFFEPPDSATITHISSSNINDDQFVGITGLGQDFVELPLQIVQLQGQTKVPLPTPLTAINFAENLSGLLPFQPTKKEFLGEVFIYEDTTITAGVPNDPIKVKEHIAIGTEVSQHGIFTVPKGKTAYLLDAILSLSKKASAAAVFEAYIIPRNNFGTGARRQIQTVGLSTSATSAPYFPAKAPIALPEKTTFLSIADLGGTNVQGSFTVAFLVAENR